VFNVEAEGRQKVEDCRQKHLVDEEKISLLEALGLGLFPWRLLGLFPWLEKLWALFPWFLGFVKHCTVEIISPLVGSWTLLTYVMALPGETKSSPVSVLGTTTGNLAIVLRSVGAFRFL
jgi:hypothetical protein